MFKFVGARIARLRRHIYFDRLPLLVDKFTELMTRRAIEHLKAKGIRRILVDNTVIAHAVTHETQWIDKSATWGGKHKLEAGYLARVPVHRDDDRSIAYRSILFLPGIASLARRGYLKLVISDELRDEQFTQPIGRYKGYYYFDYSLFKNVNFELIRDPQYSFVMTSGAPSHEEQRKQRLAAKDDPLYHELVNVLGPRNSQDAWHIVTGERNDCYCFLTMDFKLIRNVRAQSENETIKALTVRVLSPQEFGQEFGIGAVPPRWFSYHEAESFVEHRLSRPNSRRHKPRKKQ